MKKAPVIWAVGVTAFLGLGLLSHSSSASHQPAAAWDPQKAAGYLEQRIAWWMDWTGSARGNGTFCISCHTAVPYALGRPALRAALDETAPSPNERRLIEDINQRVRLGDRVAPYYNDTGGANKLNESRGTEAVLNAVVLASYDARSGHLTNDTRLALSRMWSLQIQSGPAAGSWAWLQFGNEPFEGHDSAYYGAALAAVAAGIAPEQYRSSLDIQMNLKLLAAYLGREGADQSPINQTVLLWASVGWPELITAERRRSIIESVTAKQQKDGGWNLGSLAWSWNDWNARSLFRFYAKSYGTPLKGQSDAYATALIAFVLEKAGISREEGHLSRALGWLTRNQNPADGRWTSYSLNNRRDPNSPTGLFMSDAATAYAVLALTGVN